MGDLLDEEKLIPLGELDLLALMPCPLKVPLTELFAGYVRDRSRKKGIDLQCRIESNANRSIDYFAAIAACQSPDELPAIMIAPGFNHFFHRRFKEKFIKPGYFQAVGMIGPRMDWGEMDLRDPEGSYDILSFNPTVMLVDRTNHPDLPLPKRWIDLNEPEYTGLVALRGHLDSNFCEGLFLNTYKEQGEEGIRRLGKAAKIGLHPSQMVKYAGSGKKEAPAVSTIPYSFARLLRPSGQVALIWPEDGAIVNPLLMLVKTECRPQVREMAEMLAGRGIGEIFAAAGFPSPHPQVVNNLPPQARFKWLGWDFLKEKDLGELVPRLEKIFLSVYLEGKG